MMMTLTKVANELSVGHCHVDISWRWPHVKCNLN